MDAVPMHYHARVSTVSPVKASLTQSAYERLRADVLACHFEPDQRLNISELCETLGVSLGAVREALSRLTSEGLVVAEPQRGFRVAQVSPQDLHDLYSARIEIESLCLRRSIEVGTLAWESRLVAAYYSISKTPEYVTPEGSSCRDEWLQRHADFHAALVSGCDNAWLLRMRAQLFDHAQRYRRLSVSLSRTKRNVNKEHKDLMEAALARDADRATALMREHLQLTTKILLKSIADSKK